MFITLQFPLFDNRYFLTDVNRTIRPEWPTPQQHDRVRYFGEVIGRGQQYLGPWDDGGLLEKIFPKIQEAIEA